MVHGKGQTGGGHSGEQGLSRGVFTVALALALWLALGSLVLALVDGGPHPTRRAVIGVVLVVASAAALWQRRRLCAWLRRRPWLVVPVALAELAAAVVDGLPEPGPYAVFSMTSIALAVVVARPRTVWLTVGVLECSYAAVVLLDRSPAQVVESGRLSTVLGALLGYPCAALIGLGLVSLFTRFLDRVPQTLEALRNGVPALTPALTHAVERGPRPCPQLPPPSPASGLTPTERRVVEGLAEGSAPKEIAYRWGVSIATIRTHIRHAKRKTRARTLSELAGMAARADWPDNDDRAS
ncbi:MAG: Bacterial regulatory protein luxR family [Solirubrobacteraceae bacterium]|jgi:DNA-binding CsgD family transcriptional regulator|nr:Bacterial regulatory protein luxR family [Solirubrobacteraceae bacterium]